jgi:FMN phosphatase YigB (HAD superfamily)
MGRRNLLLCFDAFGTLFSPKRSIAEQYAAVARQCGLDGFGTENDVQASFKAAFSSESKAHPNYGKASGMGAPTWWTNVRISRLRFHCPLTSCQVIHKTFQPLAGVTELPKDLAPRLLHRFSSNEGYNLSPGVASLLRSLKQQHQQQQQQGSPRLIVGVITNSDNRVPSILSSFGLRVSPLRAGMPFDPAEVAGQQYDIDLHSMSYDVGFAKPDRRIFDAAEDMANQLLAVQEAANSRQDICLDKGVPWLKLYVGDEYEKDVVGASHAGWNSVFIRSQEYLSGEDNILDLDQLGDRALEGIFPPECPSLTIQAESTQNVLEWLTRQYSKEK